MAGMHKSNWLMDPDELDSYWGGKKQLAGSAPHPLDDCWFWHLSLQHLKEAVMSLVLNPS